MAGCKVDIERGYINRTEKNAFPKFQQYVTKKTLASGLLDFCLLMASATQLKALLDVGPDGYEYYWLILVLISLSIVLQLTVGVIMLILGGMNAKTKEEQSRANRLNDIIVGFIFVITILNLFISVFNFRWL